MGSSKTNGNVFFLPSGTIQIRGYKYKVQNHRL
jgi:hypothetical protein